MSTRGIITSNLIVGVDDDGNHIEAQVWPYIALGSGGQSPGLGLLLGCCSLSKFRIAFRATNQPEQNEAPGAIFALYVNEALAHAIEIPPLAVGDNSVRNIEDLETTIDVQPNQRVRAILQTPGQWTHGHAAWEAVCSMVWAPMTLVPES